VTITPDILPDEIYALKAALVAERAEPIIVTAKLNDVDPQAWHADLLSRIVEHPALRINELLPLNWRSLAPTCQPAGPWLR